MKKLIFAILGVLLIALAAAAAGQAGEQFAEYRVSGNKLSAAGDYWTNARMMNAKPYPMPHPKGEPPLPAPLALEETPPGPPGFDPSSKGGMVSALLSDHESEAPALSGALSELSDSEKSGVVTTAGGYAYPPPHNTFKVLFVSVRDRLLNFPLQGYREGIFHPGRYELRLFGFLHRGQSRSDGRSLPVGWQGNTPQQLDLCSRV